MKCTVSYCGHAHLLVSLVDETIMICACGARFVVAFILVTESKSYNLLTIVINPLYNRQSYIALP